MLRKKRWLIKKGPLVISLLLVLFLIWLPTGYEGAVIYQGTDHCAAEVLGADNSHIIDTGLVRSGEQSCTLRLLNGRFKGQEVEGYNILAGSLEADKIFAVGDKALVVVHFDDETILSVNMIDHMRLGKEAVLAGIFAGLLFLVAGWTGLRAILSFVLTVLMLWKVLVPCYLSGLSPVPVGLIVTLGLVIMTISLVYGFERRALAAISGSSLGLTVTALAGIVSTKWLLIHGAVMSYSESLLYSGYQHLNLTQIFMASIFIGSSGALMDLAVDITSAVQEVVEKKPDISRREAVCSGLHVGRAAMGTMTTTLLLAYSGGYIALLMVFMAQGTPIDNILNYKYVAAEMIDTIVGSAGLITVAPFTALTSGCLLAGRRLRVKIDEA